MTRKFFGTDGIRGRANNPTPRLIFGAKRRKMQALVLHFLSSAHGLIVNVFLHRVVVWILALRFRLCR